MIKQRKVLPVILLMITLLLTGCGKRDTTIEVKYVSELSISALEELHTQGAGASITVAQFVDSRDAIGVAGAKNPIGNVAVSYSAKTPLSELMTDTIGEELTKAGRRVETMGYWDLNPERLQHLTTALAMGGEIKVFWAENRP